MDRLGIENLFWIGFVGGALALLFALIQLGRVLPLPLGESPAQGLSAALRKGTNAYLKWQLLLSGGLLVLALALLAGLYLLELLELTALCAFLSGSLCSLLVGASAAKLTAAAGPRAANAAGERLDRGLNAALCAGSAVSFLAVGLGLLHVTGWFFLLRHLLEQGPEETALSMLCLGAGSGLTALLLHMGSLFSSSARLAGRMVDREMGLPPDSQQNPVAIALRVGHGVGSAAGTAAGIHWGFESSLLAAFTLGANAYTAHDMGWNALLFPLATAAAGIPCSIIASFAVPPRDRGDRYSLPWSVRISQLLACLLTAVVSFPLSYFLTGRWDLCWAVTAGLTAGFFSSLLGEYFTADTYKPARALAQTAETGEIPALIGALGSGFTAAGLPGLLTVGSLVTGFLVTGGASSPAKGLYGMALAVVGMTSVWGIFLASSLCGPMGDNAADTLSLIDDEEASRRRADSLAALGSASAGAGRCLDALLTASTGLLLLLHLSGLLRQESGLSPALPALPLGALLGGLAALLFLGLLLRGVRRTALSAAAQAQEQFQASEGLLEGDDDPDYAACVSRCGSRALVCSLLPFLLALLSPPAAGFLLGRQGLLGFLGALLLLTFLLGPALSLSGGVLSGARRFVESGKRGGRGSECHRSTLRAEGALAPLRDVAGPALVAFLRLALSAALVCWIALQACDLPSLLG